MGRGASDQAEFGATAVSDRADGLQPIERRKYRKDEVPGLIEAGEIDATCEWGSCSRPTRKVVVKNHPRGTFLFGNCGRHILTDERDDPYRQIERALRGDDYNFGIIRQTFWGPFRDGLERQYAGPRWQRLEPLLDEIWGTQAEWDAGAAARRGSGGSSRSWANSGSDAHAAWQARGSRNDI